MATVLRLTGLVRSTLVRARLGYSLLLLVTGLFCVGLAQAAPAPLTQDTYVNGGSGQRNKNFGVKTVILVELVKPKRGLVQFDLSALGGTVTSAMLTFNVTVLNVAGNVDFHVVLAPWNEAVVTFNTMPAFDPTVTNTVAVSAGDVGTTVSLDITAIAQAWVSSPGTNFGLALLPATADVSFGTKDGGLGATLDVTTDGGAPPPPPPLPGAELSISSVVIDFNTDLIIITGANFDNGAVPVVELGEFGTLASTPISPTVTEATLPGFVTDGDYLLVVTTGPADEQSAQYDLTVDEELTEAEVDAFVSNNGFSTGAHYTDAEAVTAVGPHTVDTDTTRSDAEILGVVGPHTVDTDTTRSDAEILGVVGPHTVDTDTTRSDAEILTVVGPHTLVSFGIANTGGGVTALASNTTGSKNTAIGQAALLLNTTGDNNTASGVFALLSNTGGSNNTASGFQALKNNTGSDNTATGTNALLGNSNGSRNVAIGGGTLQNSSGDNNTAIGRFALLGNTTGSNNIAVSRRAGQNQTTGNNNIAIGNLGVAGESSTIRIGTPGAHGAAYIAGISGTAVTGDPVVVDANGQLGTTTTPIGYTDADAIAAVGPHYADADAIAAVGPHTTLDQPAVQALGFVTGAHTTLDQPAVQALGFVTGAHYNDASAIAAVGPHYSDAQAIVAVGPHEILSDANNNTAAGSNALDSLTTGVGNSGFGINALTSNTEGNENTALGHGTLFANIDGGQNVAVGYNALLQNTSGHSNTALGVDALNLNTSGAANTAVGRDALAANDGGTSSVAFGVSALNSHVNGAANNAFGNFALASLTSGQNNTAIGNASLRSIGGNSSRNTAVGSSSMNNTTSGSENTALGYLAGRFTTGSFNIMINNEGVAGESGAIRIGTSGQQTSTFIAGISGTPVTGDFVAVDANGQLGTTNAPIVYTDADAIAAVGPHTVLDQPAVEALGFVTGSHTVLDQPAVEALGFVTGPHTVDTDTTRSDAEILGVVGPHTVDTDTQLDEAQVDAFVADNGFSTGPHTLESFGTGNVRGGTNALASNTTGSENSAYGVNALASNTTSSGNTAYGANALKNNTAFGSTAFGFNALRDITNASGNTAIGSSALVNNVTGINNTALGRGAFSGSTGDGNTAIGWSALFQFNSGSNNIAIGQTAGNTIITGSDNIAIGNPGVGSESSTIRLGRFQTRTFIAGIEGTDLTATGTPVVINASGQLGVGSTSSWTDGAGQVTTPGNVGIGTTIPQYKLEVHGGIFIGAATSPPTIGGKAGLFNSGGELFTLDGAGNTTQISPHDPDTGEWIFYSKNIKTGRVVRVNMERLIKKMEEITGEKYIEEWIEDPEISLCE